MQNYPLALDTAHSGIQQTVTGFYCGDAGEKQLCITLLHQNTVYTPQAGTLALCGKKPDGTRFLHTCSVSGSQVYYLPTAQALAAPGTVECQLIVYGDNGSVLYAPRFAIEVEQPLQPQDNLVSADEWLLLPVDVLSGLSATDGDTLLLNGHFVGAVAMAETFSDLPTGFRGRMAYVRTADNEHPYGFYGYDTQWEPLSQIDHTHTNKTVLDTVTANVVSDSHTHVNAQTLARFGAQDGVPTFDGNTIGDPPDTLVPLALDTTYPTLTIRPDWASVPVYSIDDNPVVCRIASESEMGGIPVSEIRLYYLTDYQTGMPVPTLRVITGGDLYICYAAQFHDMGQTYAAGWYDAEGTQLDAAPTLENMRFDYFVVSNNEEITDFTGLSGESLCALQTISRMVNVSAAAMGSLGVVENGVQRLNHAPQTGRRYAFTTDRDVTFPLPALAWSDKDREFRLDLTCTGSINLTFTGSVCYEDGNNIDTTTGTHRLHFYAPAVADQWTIAETESVPLVTEDVIPPYAVPFRNVTAEQLRAILKYGYSNNDGDWCVRIGGTEVVFFHVGDTRPVTLTNGQEVTLRIIGIHHDDLPASGKAALTCDFKELIPVTAFQISGASYSYYINSVQPMLQAIYNTFPDYLKQMVTKAQKYFPSGTSFNNEIWLLSSKEIGDTATTNNYDTAYPVFTNNASRIRYTLSGTPDKWIQRTESGNYWIGATNTGAIQGSWYGVGTSINSFAVGFCLNVA